MAQVERSIFRIELLRQQPRYRKGSRGPWTEISSCRRELSLLVANAAMRPDRPIVPHRELSGDQLNVPASDEAARVNSNTKANILRDMLGKGTLKNVRGIGYCWTPPPTMEVDLATLLEKILACQELLGRRKDPASTAHDALALLPGGPAEVDAKVRAGIGAIVPVALDGLWAELLIWAGADNRAVDGGYLSARDLKDLDPRSSARAEPTSVRFETAAKPRLAMSRTAIKKLSAWFEPDLNRSDRYVDVLSCNVGNREIHMTVSDTDFESVATLAYNLDEPLPDDGGTLRELHADYFASLPFHQSGPLPPIPSVLGLDAVLVSSDNQLILTVPTTTLVRNPSHTGTRRVLHCIARGCSLDADGNFDLMRALDDALTDQTREIGLKLDTQVVAKTQSGLFYDTQRSHFVATFLVQTTLHSQTFRDLFGDEHDPRSVVPFDFELADGALRLLLVDQHPDFVLRSNHASAAVWAAVRHKHGPQAVNNALRHCRPHLRPGGPIEIDETA